MRRGNRNKGFGRPSRLAGQPKEETEAQRLRREADAMAKRIAEMRGQILTEKRIRAKDKRTSATGRWRSSSGITHKGGRRRRRQRSDATGPPRRGDSRGSQRRQIEGSGASKAAPPSRIVATELRGGFGDRTQRQFLTKAPDGVASPPTSARHREGVSDWDEEEVSRWLDRIGLPQYQKVFKANAINGETLTAMDKADLDYLGIKALGHRKMLLAGIAEIKMDQSSMPPASTKTNTSTTSSSKPLPQKVHWLDAAKKADAHPDRKKNSALPPVNSLLDGDYDEAREKERFQAAVMAWRNGGSSEPAATAKTSAVNTAASKPKEMVASERISGKHESDGGKLLEGQYDEQRERKRFEAAVMEWRNGTKAEPAEASSEWINPFGPMPEAHPPPSKDGGKLLKGNLDADAEQQMFQKAVLDWRKGDTGTKASCWQCFKLFSPNNNVLKMGEKKFCGEGCHTTFVATAKAAKLKKAQHVQKKVDDTKEDVVGSMETAKASKVGQSLFCSAINTGDAAVGEGKVADTAGAGDATEEGAEKEDDPRAKLISFLNWEVDIKY